MGLFNHFPYTNFHELNIDWAIEKIKELLTEGEALYAELREWKTDTDTELAAWKTQTLADLSTWEANIAADLEGWKHGVEIDFAAYEAQFQTIKTACETYRNRAEAWAVGQIAGVDVPDTDDAYHNNAKYWAEEAADSADEAEETAASGVKALANEAVVFDATEAYSEGDYVLYNGDLYRFTADHAAGAWTGTDAISVKLGSEVGDLKNTLEPIENAVDVNGIYPFAVADKNGQAAFIIDENGIAKFKQYHFEANADEIAHTDNEGNKAEEYRGDGLFDFAVCDKDGKILFYADSGILKVFGIDAERIYNPEFRSVAKSVKKIKMNEFDDGNFDSEINMFICYGQSWSTGYEAKAITLSQRYDNLMLNTGIMNNPLDDMNQTASSFSPMVERTGKSSSADNAMTVGETPVSAQSNIIKQLIKDENGYQYTDFPYQILGTAPGYGDKTLMELKKGTIYYARLIDQVSQAKQIADSLNKNLVVQAFSWAQGELGVGATGTYAENLEQLRLDIDADVKTITGQTQDVKCITWQAFLYTANAAAEFYARYVGASETYPNIICSGPAYHLDHVMANNLHFTPDSQDWLGAYFGVAYKRTIIDGTKFVPLKPISATHRGNVLYVKFNVPQKPLVFDTSQVAEADNYGFNLYNSGNDEKTIESVEIINPDTIKIVCSSAISTTDYLTYSQNAGSAFGRLDGNRGNLRDSQGDYITYLSGINTKLPIHNWCVIFNKNISDLED